MITVREIEQTLWSEVPGGLHDRVPQLAQVIADALVSETTTVFDPRLVEAIRQLQRVNLNTSQGPIEVGNIKGTGIAVGHGSISLVVNLRLDSNQRPASFSSRVDFRPTERNESSLRAEFLSLLNNNNNDIESVQKIRYFLAENPNILMNWILWRTGSDAQCLSNVICEDTIIDFAVGINQTTIGQWEWKLILLESPSVSYCTPQGNYTPYIEKAIERASYIRQTLRLSLKSVQKTLPDLEPDAPVIIVGGRRANVTEAEKRRIQLLKLSMPGIVLNSYDSIVDSWKG